MADKQNTLATLREQIDSIDQKILQLINQRAEQILAVKAFKERQQAEPIIYRPEREAQQLRQLAEQNPGPLNNKQVAQIFRAILSTGRELQKPLTIAFLGPEGTFSHAAVIAHFGHANQLAPTNTINDIVNAVKNGQADYGVIPIENSTEGVVNASLDALIGTSLQVIGETILPIHHHLLINPRHQTTITRIYSHPQSLAQCRHWLQTNYPDAEKIAVNSNAQAAQLASREQGSAAIAGELAAEKYQLAKINENIADHANNRTRFLLLGSHAVPPSGDDKTSLFVYVSNTPGALSFIAEPFSTRNINITLPTSRPSGQEIWSYVFYLEIEGHQEEPHIQQALEELQKNVAKVQILGSYPKTV